MGYHSELSCFTDLVFFSFCFFPFFFSFSSKAMKITLCFVICCFLLNMSLRFEAGTALPISGMEETANLEDSLPDFVRHNSRQIKRMRRARDCAGNGIIWYLHCNLGKKLSL